MHHSFRDWDIRLFNLETLTVLAYTYRDTKVFAL